MSIDTTPDYNYYKIINPEKQRFKNDVIKQLSSNKKRAENDYKINREEELRARGCYEEKMKQFEHIEQKNKDKVKKALWKELNWQIRNNMKKGYMGV